MLRRVLLVVCVLSIAACGERIQASPQAGSSVAVPAFEWRVVDRPTLEAVYRASGKNIGDGGRLEGFAGTTHGGVVVVYTLPPQTVDDSVTCTLGHEVMHVALGSYHGEK